MTPLVSFVVPCYNYARYLPECLAGIFAQGTDIEFEIIAIDDASTDTTVATLESYTDRRMRVIKHGLNQGHIATVNRGISEARGRYVVRIDPDDRHRPGFLKATIPKLERFPEVGLAYTDVALINADGEVTLPKVGSEFGPGDRKGNELVRILRKNYICAPTVIARREAWMAAWPVPQGLAFNDWYFNVMLARRHEFYFVDEVLADYRVHPQNHHSRIVLDKSEEQSLFWVLDKVYAETEQSSELQGEKDLAKQDVYAAHYLDLATKYFGVGYFADARRCYWQALMRKPGLWFRTDVARRFMGTLLGPRAYEYAKQLSRRLFLRAQ